MAVAKTLLPMESVASPTLDLKWSLTLRVVAVALVCFLVAAALALLGTYRDVRQVNENVADIVVRQLQVQLFRIDPNIDVSARFPDWDAVGDARPKRRSVHPICQGRTAASGARVASASIAAAAPRRPGFPPWADGSSPAASTIARPISYHGKSSGTLVVTTETAAVLAAIWKDVSGLLGLTALVVGAICVLQFVAISRALRPTKDILAGLDQAGARRPVVPPAELPAHRASAHQRGLQHARGKPRPDDARANGTRRPARRRTGAGAAPSGARASR